MIYLIIILICGLLAFLVGKYCYVPQDYSKIDYSPATQCGIILSILVMIIVGIILWLIHLVIYGIKTGAF